MTSQTAEQIAEIINQAGRGVTAKMWEKNGKSRVYLTLTSNNRGVGYIDLTGGNIDMRPCLTDTVRHVLRDNGVEW